MASMFSAAAAERFILQTARPFERAACEVLYRHQAAEDALRELRKFQNEDGGFGHALEPDNWNPHSSPIATNDAVIWLYRMDAFVQAGDITRGIADYLDGHDAFDEEARKWLFSIDTNRDYPHAVWWEKKGDGIEGYNPTVSLAAFMVCYGNRRPLYEEILKSAVTYLESAEKPGGDLLKCYLLAHALLRKKQITDIIDLEYLRVLMMDRIQGTICPDTEKYGVEYVTTPSDLFSGVYLDFVSEGVLPLVRAELDMIGKLQKEDGGFDIAWQWYTPYPEFAQARAWWRPRITLEKLLFVRVMRERGFADSPDGAHGEGGDAGEPAPRG